MIELLLSEKFLQKVEDDLRQDLAKIAAEYEPQLPRAFRFLTRSLRTRETSNVDFMSLFMFVPEYLQRLIDIGEADAEAKIAAITSVATPRLA